MTPHEMRLRLVVRRHTLPETRIVFAVPLDTDPTIADFIELVNGLIPLESEDWGLEDYAVELHDADGNAFECLHFQHVAAVLKQDEEVFIRPLLSGDHKKRRLSGRDQISSDGRHLIDGVAFGSQRLKPPRQRPPVPIPPLKRRRITYDAQDEGQDIDHQDLPQLLPLRNGRNKGILNRVSFDVSDGEEDTPDWATSIVRYRDQDDADDGDDEFLGDAPAEANDANDGEDDASDDSDDSADDDESVDEESVGSGGSDLENELRDLQADNEKLGEAIIQEHPDCPMPQAPPVNALLLDPTPSLTLTDLDMITALRAAFPTASVDICEKTLLESARKGKRAYKTLQSNHEANMSIREMFAYLNTLRNKDPNTDGDEQSEQSDASEAESLDSIVKHYDRHGFPSGSILSGTASTHMAETLRRSGQLVKLPVHTRFEDSLDAAQPDDSARSGPDGNDSSSSESDSGPEVQSSRERLANGPVKPASSHDGSSDEDSASSSNSDSSDSDSDDDSDSSGSPSGDISDTSSDDGSNSDDYTNDGDDDDESLHNFQDKGDDRRSKSSSERDSDSSDDDRDPASGSTPGARLPLNSTPGSRSEADYVHEPSAPGPTDVSSSAQPNGGSSKTQRRNARRRAAAKAKRAVLEAELAAEKAALLKRLGIAKTNSPRAATESPIPAPATLAAGEPPRADGTQSGAETGQHETQAEEDPEAWRDKIVYRAVECCDGNVELSEPPFPFYQRWDPQQLKQARASKRKHRDQSDFYNADTQSKKKRKTSRHAAYAGYDAEDGFAHGSAINDVYMDNADVVLNYDDEVESEAEDMSAMMVDQNDEEDDLPPLPADLSTLPILQAGEARPGMILTWKQWLLSRATNWQPQVSSFTGVVMHVLEDKALRVLLAKRDRALDQNEKEYDDEGNRVYDKFELPGMDDEVDEDAELGYRTLDFMDMIEPRILQQAAEGESLTSPSSQQDTSLLIESQMMETSMARVQDGTAKPGADSQSSLDNGVPAKDDSVRDGAAEYGTQQRGEDMIPETDAGSVSEPQPVQLGLDEDVSITEDRRHEISLLINNAGFLKDLDPSIANMTVDEPAQSRSPSRQLEEALQQAASPSFSQGLPDMPNPPDSPPGPSQVSQRRSQASGQSTLLSMDSQPIILEPFHGFSDANDGPGDHHVEYPVLDLPPSDIGSTHSGRQTDPDFSIELGNESPERLQADGTAGGSRFVQRSLSPLLKKERKATSASPAKSVSSTGSFPSLSEICLTASTNGSGATLSQTDTAPAMKTRKSDAAADPDYETAIRRLDDGASDSSPDSDDDPSPKRRIEMSADPARELLKRPIGKPTIKRKVVKEEESGKPSNSAQRARVPRRSGQSEPFSIPEGSQVVSLISSSAEPALEDNYAEDSVDETYLDVDALSSDSYTKEKKNRKRLSLSTPLSALTSSKRGNAHTARRLISSQGKLGRGASSGQKKTKKKTTIRGY